MFEKTKNRIVIILSILIASCYFLWPTYQLYANPDSSEIIELEKKTLGLGLDLKGGLRITLELDNKTFLQKLIKQNLSNKSKVELDGIIEESDKNSIINNSSIIAELKSVCSKGNIKLNKFYSNLSKSTDNDKIIDKIEEQKSYAMASILEVMRNRIQDHDQYGLGEPSIQSIGTDRIVVELAGITDLKRAKDYIQRTADFELSLVRGQAELVNVLRDIDSYIASNKKDFMIFSIPGILDSLVFADPSSPAFIVEEGNYKLLDTYFKFEEIKNVIPNHSKIVWENTSISFVKGADERVKTYRRLYLVSSKPAISSGMIQTPKALISDFGTDNAGQWVVNLDMNKEGRRKWSSFTGKHINRQVAILLDNKVFMAPFIRDKITTGNTQISGFDNMQEAKDIAAVLKAGELPAPIRAIQTNYIGPSLGADSIKSGMSAMKIGIVLVFLFMIIYYKFSGIIASIALIMNLILVLAVLVTMNAVLTLPGIAGLLLTVGMTVDANVIIFERLKEEILLGQSPKASLIRAYNKAFLTIFDANITTLLTAFVLSFIGSGPIKGFATTLSVGIICSMFTAVFVTKTIFMIYLNYNNKISI